MKVKLHQVFLVAFFILFCLFADSNVSAEEHSFSTNLTANDVSDYLNTPKGIIQTTEIISETLKRYNVIYDVDKIGIENPVNLLCWRYKTSRIDTRDSLYLISGIYYEDKLIGVVYFDTVSSKSNECLCYRCDIISPLIIKDAQESVIIFYACGSNTFEPQDGGSVITYIKNDNGNTSMLHSYFTPSEQLLEMEKAQELNFEKVSSTALKKQRIPINSDKYITQLDINYTAPKRFFISDNNDNYFTVINGKLVLSNYENNSNLQSFNLVKCNDNTVKIINSASGRKISSRKSTKFILHQIDCYYGNDYSEEYPYELITSVIVEEKGNRYILYNKDGKIYSTVYNESFIPEENQRWYIKSSEDILENSEQRK